MKQYTILNSVSIAIQLEFKTNECLIFKIQSLCIRKDCEKSLEIKKRYIFIISSLIFCLYV